MTTENSNFNINVVISSFKDCSEQALHLDHYIAAYDELCHFFHMLGSIFGFITSDIVEKIGILKKLRDPSESTKDEYSCVESMFKFEVKRNEDSGEALLGSRTLLRLHRALAFTSLFMERLGESSDSDKASTIASIAYQDTLANFHPWLIRKAAQMAMYTLPSRGDMISKVACGQTELEVKELLKRCVEITNTVYEKTEELYTLYDLHKLP